MVAREDTYNVTEAAHLLALSPRRVRQYVHEGRLPAERDRSGAFRIPKQAVHAMRERKFKASAAKARAAPPASTGHDSDFESFLARVVAPLERALEEQSQLAARTEELLREQLAEERARFKEAQLRIEELEEQLHPARGDHASGASRPPAAEVLPDEPWAEEHEPSGDELEQAQGEDGVPSEETRSDATVRIIGGPTEPEPSLPPYEPNLEPPRRAKKRDEVTGAEDRGPFSLLRRRREPP